MLIEIWQGKEKDTLRFITLFWNHFVKILKFWHKLVTSSIQNWLEKCPKLATVRLISEMRFSVSWTCKRNLEVINAFTKLFYEILARFCGDIISKWAKMTKICISWVIGSKILKSGTITTFVQHFFSDRRISEFWNIDPRCDYVISKLELWKQNLHLRCVQILKIAEGFVHIFSWLPFRRVTLKDIVNVQAYYNRPDLSNFDKMFGRTDLQSQ